MPSSGIIDLAIGMAFVFGVTAALASVVTELIARFFGLRGDYLLRGLRELLDGGRTETVLTNAEKDYKTLTDFVEGQGTAKPASATGALLGSPILRSQGMVGEITSRDLTVPSARPPAAPATPATPAGQAAAAAQPEERQKKPGFITKKTQVWRDRRSLPAYIPARSFADAIIDLVVPAATGKTTIDDLATNVGKLPPDCRRSSCRSRRWSSTQAATSTPSAPPSSTGTTITWIGCPAGTSGTSPRSHLWSVQSSYCCSMSTRSPSGARCTATAPSARP